MGPQALGVLGFLDLTVYFEDPFSGSVKRSLEVWRLQSIALPAFGALSCPGNSVTASVCDPPRGPAGLCGLEGME